MAKDDLERLMERVANGDRRAFERLYASTHRNLYGLCLRILQDRTEAEDAMQAAYEKVWRYAERYAATRARPMTFLIAITRNLCIDRLRERRAPGRALDAATSVAEATERAERRAMAKGDAQQLSACLEALGERNARLVRVAYFGGATYAALAERDATPLGTLKSRTRGALATLRECLVP